MNLENWTDLQLLVLGLLDGEDDVDDDDDDDDVDWISDDVCAMMVEGMAG